ncbi:MAG: hypothetical protein ACKOD2_03035 [Ilumatobacteraceae bacterium]
MLAVVVTLVAVVAFSLGGGSSDENPDEVPGGEGTNAASVTANDGDGTEPADPAFLPTIDSIPAPDIITVNGPAPPQGTVLRGTANFIRWPRTMGLLPCATPHALIGSEVKVTNLNNGRSITCNNVSIESLRDGSVIIIHTDEFLELADLVDSPIPVEIEF